MNTNTGVDIKPLRTESIDGHSVQIYIDAASGDFYAKHEGANVSAESLKALVARMRSVLRTTAVRLAVPACLVNEDKPEYSRRARAISPTVEDVTITGVHGRTGNALIKRADGKTEQFSGYEHELVRRLTKAEREKYVKLATAKREAIVAFDDFAKSIRFENGFKDYLRREVAKHTDAETTP